MGRFGIWELVIIAVLVLVVFGGRRLPELGKGLGQGWMNFRQALRPQDRPDEGEDLSAAGKTAENESSGQAGT